MSESIPMHNYYCTEFQFATPEYDESIKLRYDILRKPLKLEFSPEDLALEFDSFHIACYEKYSGEMVACLILKPIDSKKLKMRQVAVSEKYQSKGVGSFLVKWSEEFALENGYQKIELHARDTAISFYKKAGYESSGPTFKEVGIEHIFMYKNLI